MKVNRIVFTLIFLQLLGQDLLSQQFQQTPQGLKVQLRTGAREGHYPGMAGKHIFNIVIVGKDHGAGPDAATPFTSVEYTGQQSIVKYKP